MVWGSIGSIGFGSFSLGSFSLVYINLVSETNNLITNNILILTPPSEPVPIYREGLGGLSFRGLEANFSTFQNYSYLAAFFKHKQA